MTKDKDTKTVVPALRFPEFRDADRWSEKAIDKICKSFSGGTPKTTESNYYGGDIPFIRSAEINKEFTELFLTEDGLLNSAAKLVTKGDVLVALYGANSGDVAISKINGAINQAILCLKSKDCNQFLCQYLTLKKDDIISTYIQGGQGNLSGEIIKSLKLLFPTTKEQKKIADCLGSLDDLISAVAAKIEVLKEHKKGLMQQLFPADGKNAPTLRFPEFKNAGEWQETTLGKLFKIGNGKDYKHLNIGDIPVYGSGGYMTSVDNYLYDGESVCIGRKGTIDKPMFLTGKFWTVDTLFYTHSFVNCIPKFIYMYFQHINWLKHNEAGGVPSLSKTNIEKIKVFVPIDKKNAEQKKIADFLSSVDQLISSEIDKLNQLKAHKKGLMQQLFPTINE